MLACGLTGVCQLAAHSFSRRIVRMGWGEGYLWWQPRGSPGFDGWVQLIREEFSGDTKNLLLVRCQWAANKARDAAAAEVAGATVRRGGAPMRRVAPRA